MKKSIYTLAVLVLASTFAVQAAADVKRKTTVEVTTSDSGSRLGFGYSTFMTSAGSKGAMSVWLDFSRKVSLQPFISVTSSDPFNFDFGSVFRIKVHGSDWGGFHVGGGFDLGTVTAAKTFFLNIFPVAGFSFNLGGAASNVALSFDGGPMFHVTPSPFVFALDSLSALGGASIHYFF